MGLTVGGVLGTPEQWHRIVPSLRLRPNQGIDINLNVRYEWRRNPNQWIGQREVGDSTRYILGQIDSRTLRLTTRVDWTMSPTLSLQFYAQPFVSAGRYDNFKEVTEPNADSFDERFNLFGSALSCVDGVCEVDVTDDDTADFSFGQPHFNVKQLRSTTVLRWEYRPGRVERWRARL